MTDFVAGTVANADGTVTINTIVKISEDFPRVRTKAVTPVGLAGDLLVWESKIANPSIYKTTTYTTKDQTAVSVRDQILAMSGTTVTFIIQDATSLTDNIIGLVEDVTCTNHNGITNSNDTLTIATWKLKTYPVQNPTPANLA